MSSRSERAPRADRLAADADALERLAVDSRRVVSSIGRVVVERLDAELIGEDEAVRQMAERHLLGADGAGPDAVHALRAEEAELVLREAVEVLCRRGSSRSTPMRWNFGR